MLDRWPAFPRWFDTFTGETVVLRYLNAEDLWLVYLDTDAPQAPYCVDGDLWQARRFRRIKAGPYRQQAKSRAQVEHQRKEVELRRSYRTRLALQRELAR